MIGSFVAQIISGEAVYFRFNQGNELRKGSFVALTPGKEKFSDFGRGRSHL
jgi:hypothetical protein